MGRVQETITTIMIERIEARRAAGENVAPPWRQTWNPTFGMPRNLVTGHPYRGVNVFMTMLAGFNSPFWLTLRQIKSLGGSLKTNGEKVESYTPIVFWKFPTPEEREQGRFPFVKFYKVWNAEQVNGIEKHVEKAMEAMGGTPVDPIAEAEALVNGYARRPEITHGSAKAFYSPNTDTVSMPSRQAFEDAEEYYRVLFHELAHSTGHRTRLERDGICNPIRFASHDYSEEELIAEMAAAMLCGHAGIESQKADENTAAYLDHWLKKLKREPNWLVSAGGAAQKAVDHIRGIRWEKAS